MGVTLRHLAYSPNRALLVALSIEAVLTVYSVEESGIINKTSEVNTIYMYVYVHYYIQYILCS